MNRDWSNLNFDILRLIAGKIRTLEDFTRVGAVCSNWNRVVMKQEEGPIFCRPQLPWLILQCQSRRAFSIMENKVHHLDFPEAYGKKCVGSSHGWLIMVEDISPAIFMLNPLTRQRIELPPVTTMPEILGFNKEEVGREYIYKSICGEMISRRSLKNIEEFHTVKIILSKDPDEEDCIAVALCGTLNRLVFCRIGDNKWAEAEHDLKAKASQSDVIYSKGKFYVVAYNGIIGVFDVRNSQVTTIYDTTSFINACDVMYLVVDKSGALLLISRWVAFWDSLSEAEREDGNDNSDGNDSDNVEDDDDDDGNHFYRTKEFKVFKLDEEKNKWNRVRDIGESVVFLGENQSVCYSTIEFPECKRNSIYFTDDNYEWQGGVHEGHDVGIFDIEDGLIRKVPCFNDDMPLMSIFPRLVWFTPTIRSSSMIKRV